MKVPTRRVETDSAGPCQRVEPERGVPLRRSPAGRWNKGEHELSKKIDPRNNSRDYRNSHSCSIIIFELYSFTNGRKPGLQAFKHW
jgi:hypothetical protein